MKPNDKKSVNAATESHVEEPSSAAAEVVGCSKLNVRQSPSPKSSIIGMLDAGTRVSINLTFKDEKYYEVLAPSGKKGYAIKTYLSLID